jgi:hypothetical protein
VELVVLNRSIGVSPEEDLLLQMQGMIAEYERAKNVHSMTAERFQPFDQNIVVCSSRGLRGFLGQFRSKSERRDHVCWS